MSATPEALAGLLPPGLSLPARRPLRERDRGPRDDSQFCVIARLCFDRPSEAARLERRLDAWLRRERACEQAWALAGYLRYSLRRYGRARDAFAEAIRLRPEHLDNWLDLGFCLRHLGQPAGTGVLFDFAALSRAYRRRGRPKLTFALLDALLARLRRRRLDYASRWREHLPR